MRRKIYFWFMLVNALGVSLTASALELPVVPLAAQATDVDLAPYVRYIKNYHGELTVKAIDRIAPQFKSVEGRSIQFGRAAPNILIVLRVQNQSDASADYVFSTDRGSATSLQIYHLKDSTLDLRFDSDDYDIARQRLATYQHYADEFSLAAGETLTLLVRSDVEDSAYFPLVIQNKDDYFANSHLTMMLAAGCTAAILALLVLNLFFYLATGRKAFVWLVAAEFFLATVVMYLVGLFSTYVFYDQPRWMLVVGDITKYAYVFCMAQFVRTFVDTKKNLPRHDMLLRTMIYFSLVMMLVQLFSSKIPIDWRINLYSVNYLLVAGSAFYFTYIGYYATRFLGRENWPLIVAWGSLAAFAVYAALAYSGAIPNLPMSFYAIAPVAVIEAAFATLAIGLSVRRSELQHRQTQADYLTSLEDKLRLSRQAQKLAEERSAALATVVDQSSLLHASGHDSQQVLLALNSAAAALKQTESSTAPNSITDIIESSANYLEKIVSTTMSGARSSAINDQLIAVSQMTIDELLQPLVTMYSASFIKAGSRLNCSYDRVITIISDRGALSRALSNLLSNSLKYGCAGEVTLTVFVAEDKLTFRLEDSSDGVEDALLSKLNSPSQIEESRVISANPAAGSGTGFRFSKRLIQRLAGSLLIQNTSVGTQADLILPFFHTNTPTDFSTLKSTMQQRFPQYQVMDWDTSSPIDIDDSGDRAEPANSELLTRLAVTTDDSIATRQRLSTQFQVVLFRPLCTEMLDLLERLPGLDGSRN